jgi:hypothetical protein
MGREEETGVVKRAFWRKRTLSKPDCGMHLKKQVISLYP